MKATIDTCLVEARRSAGRGWVVQNRRSGIVMYDRPVFEDQRTAEQLAFRMAGQKAGEVWRELGAREKDGWHRYARRWGRTLWPEGGYYVTGVNVHQACSVNRGLMGMELPRTAPAGRPPGRLVGVELLPMATQSEVREFSFRIRHRVRFPEQYVVSVSITPAPASAGRRPQEKEARLIQGFGPASLAELPASGGIVTFRDARFAITSGQRFGVVAKLIRIRDGVPGARLWAVLDRV